MRKPSGISRRRFLKQSVAAAVPLVLTRCATTPGRTIGPNDRVNVGYIGVGRRSRQLMKLPPDTQIIAYSDVYLARLEEMQEKNPSAAIYPDYREMLARPDLDAVIVASPDHWHAAHVIHACEAGKDVYVEKPMTLTIAEGQAMVKAARNHKRVVQVGSQQRSTPKNRQGCELIRNGRIGKVHTVHAANFQSPWECDLPAQPVPAGLNWDAWCGQTEPRPYHEELYLPRVRGHEAGWISYRPYSGGEMTGWGAHGLDQIQWALGMDETGPVELWNHPDQTPPFDGVHRGPTWPVSMRYANGTIVHLNNRGPGGGALFEGELGSLLIDRGKWEVISGDVDTQLSSSDLRLYDSEQKTDWPGQGDTEAHLANWIYCIRHRETPAADVAIGHRSTTMCHLGNIARWTNRRLEWDPAKEEFINDPEATSLLRRPMRKPYEI
jgi:predicted dehydrogenase